MARTRRSHYVCLPCRASWKKSPDSGRAHVCPRCGGPLTDAGTQFAAPRARDSAGWRAVSAVLAAGLRFHPSCRCCDDGPGYRPRTPREVRDRLAHAAATGIPIAKALTCADPSHADAPPERGVRRRP